MVFESCKIEKDSINKVREHIKDTGETISGFIGKAIEEKLLGRAVALVALCQWMEKSLPKISECNGNHISGFNVVGERGPEIKKI